MADSYQDLLGRGGQEKAPADLPVAMLEALGVVPEEDSISEAQKRYWDALFSGIRRVEEVVLDCESYGVSIWIGSDLRNIPNRLEALSQDLATNTVLEPGSIRVKPELHFRWDQFERYHQTLISILADFHDELKTIPRMPDLMLYHVQLTSEQDKKPRTSSITASDESGGLRKT